MTGPAGDTGATGPAGADGQDCDCTPISNAPAPDPVDNSDGLRCSIAINMANELQRLWFKAYEDSDSFIAEYFSGLATGAVVVAFLFPGLAIPAALIGTFFAALDVIRNLELSEANAFDSDAVERFRCALYCILDAENTTTITDEILSQWSLEIAADTLFPNAYVAAQFLDGTPLEQMRWIAYASSAVDPLACEECDCPEEPEDYECEGCGTPTTIVIQAESASVTGGTGTGSGGGRGWRNYNVGQTLTIDLGQEYCLQSATFVVNDNVAGTSSKQFDIGLDGGFNFVLSWPAASSGWFARRAPASPTNFNRRTRYITYTATAGVGGALDSITVVVCPVE